MTFSDKPDTPKKAVEETPPTTADLKDQDDQGDRGDRGDRAGQPGRAIDLVNLADPKAATADTEGQLRQVNAYDLLGANAGHIIKALSEKAPLQRTDSPLIRQENPDLKGNTEIRQSDRGDIYAQVKGEGGETVTSFLQTHDGKRILHHKSEVLVEADGRLDLLGGQGDQAYRVLRKGGAIGIEGGPTMLFMNKEGKRVAMLPDKSTLEAEVGSPENSVFVHRDSTGKEIGRYSKDQLIRELPGGNRIELKGTTLDPSTFNVDDVLKGMREQKRDQTVILFEQGEVASRTIHANGTVVDFDRENNSVITLPNGKQFFVSNAGELFEIKLAGPKDRHDPTRRLARRPIQENEIIAGLTRSLNGWRYTQQPEKSADQVAELGSNTGTGISPDSPFFEFFKGRKELGINGKTLLDLHAGKQTIIAPSGDKKDETVITLSPPKEGETRLGFKIEDQGVILRRGLDGQVDISRPMFGEGGNLLPSEEKLISLAPKTGTISTDLYTSTREGLTINATGTTIKPTGEVDFDHGKGPKLLADGTVKIDGNYSISRNLVSASDRSGLYSDQDISARTSFAVVSAQDFLAIAAKVGTSSLSSIDAAIGSVYALLANPNISAEARYELNVALATLGDAKGRAITTAQLQIMADADDLSGEYTRKQSVA